MDHFGYRDGVLHAEEVPVAELVGAYGTPLHCVSRATLEHHYRVLERALDGLDRQICYAPKANGSLAVLRVLARLGAGADVVSEGEFRLALAAGIPAAAVVFSGVGKTRAEMDFALRNGIGLINVESAAELEVLDAAARAAGCRAPVAFRINPDVETGGHGKLSTGRAGDKFGVPLEAAPELYARAAALEGIEVTGVDMHIGSQLPSLAPFEIAFGRLRELADSLRAAGHRIDRVDLGGGIGAWYGDGIEPPLPEAYGELVRRIFGDADYRIILEPGRMIAANAGILIARALYEKEAGGHRMLVVDAGMNDLMRPALYGAYHEVVPVREAGPEAVPTPCDVVGPVCEPGDTFARGHLLPPVAAEELVVFRSAGAYGAAMASEYNARPRVAEAMVSGWEHALTRARGSYAEMLRRERVPGWLA